MHHIETLPLRGVQYHRSLRKIPRGRLVQFRDPIAEQAGPRLGFRCTFVVPGGEQMVEELLYLNGNDIGYFESILDLGDRPAVDVTDLMAFHVKDPAHGYCHPKDSRVLVMFIEMMTSRSICSQSTKNPAQTGGFAFPTQKQETG